MKKKIDCSLEDYIKVSKETDRILFSFKYNKDVLALSPLSPIRADLFANVLKQISKKNPPLVFYSRQLVQFIINIIHLTRHLFHNFKLSLSRDSSKLGLQKSSYKKKDISTLILTHADQVSQIFNDEDLYYGNRSTHRAHFCVMNKSGVSMSGQNKHKYAKEVIELPYIIEIYDVGFKSTLEIYIKMLRLFTILLYDYLKSSKGRFKFYLLVDSISLTTFVNLNLAKQLRLLISSTNYSTIISTWEGHPWERILAYLCNKYKINLFAYIHAGPFSTQHAAFRTLPKYFLPYKYLTPTKISQSFLRNNYSLESKVVGTHKYNSILSLQKALKPSGKISRKSRRLLLLPQGTLKEIYDLSRIAFSINLYDVYVVVRLHPAFISNNKLHNYLKLLRLKTKYSSNIIISNQSLTEDIKNSTHFLFRGSTAAVEAASTGITPIYCMSNDPFYNRINSLDGFYLPDKLKITNQEELRQVFISNIEYSLSLEVNTTYNQPISLA